MTGIEATLRESALVLEPIGVRWALVGGLAVSVRTEPRFTRDIDLAVATSDDLDAERLVFEMSKAGFKPTTSIEQEASGRLATARMLAPGETSGGIVLDLLFSSSGIEAEIATAADRLEVLPGMTVPVANTGHLLALKVLSRSDARPQDAGDIRALATACGDQEKELALEAARLIEARGHNRGRDLEAALVEAFAAG